jgi:rhodanese-related sulfurtransferase
MIKIFVLLLLIILIDFSYEIKKYPHLTSAQIENYINDSSVYLLDTRFQEESIKGYIPNSLIVSFQINFNDFISNLIEKESGIIVISTLELYKKTILILEKLNYKNILGYILINEYKGKLIQIQNTNLDKKNIKKINYDFQLIDVREEKEYEDIGIIEDSTLIPLSVFKNNMNKIKKNIDIYVICSTGFRAQAIVTYLIKKGYDKNRIFNIDGGISSVGIRGIKLKKLRERKNDL